MISTSLIDRPSNTSSSVFQPLSQIQQLKASKAFMQLVSNPTIFEAIYDLDEVLRETELSMIACNYTTAQPGVAEIVQERYLPAVPDLDHLLTYPQDSLGYQFADLLKRNNFNPQFYRPRSVTDDISYLSLRRSQTHDIYHVITGFGTDFTGEVALQAFQLAQFRSPIAIALLTAGIMNQLDHPAGLSTMMEAIYSGWKMGEQAKPFMAQKWEDAWEKPVSEWRIALNVTPI
jgi:ubiquinone biosynthesis protein COQ4